LLRHWPPAVFGELALLDGGPRTASAEAVVRSKLLVVCRADLSGWSDGRTGCQRDVPLSEHDGATDHPPGADLAFLDLQGRVARRLFELADGAGTPVPAVTQAELATMVGGIRQSVNLARRGLEERGSSATLAGEPWYSTAKACKRLQAGRLRGTTIHA
jgi:CRP/FNR family transcriptional regulator, cyclic AMP receptor protein